GGVVAAGDLLGLIVEVGEVPAKAFGLGAHVVGGVLRVGGDVVGHDGAEGNLAGVVARDVGNLLLDVDDEGAVDAEEHDEETVLLRGAAGDGGVGGVGEVVVPGEGEDA